MKIFPAAIAGLALAIASLGALIGQTYGVSDPFLASLIKTSFGLLSGFFILVFTLRIVFDFQGVQKELEDNVLARSVFPTYFMTWMVISTYLKPFLGGFATAIWAVALILQFAWLSAFLYKYAIREFDIKNVYPSWFVIGAGFVVGTTSAPAHGTLEIARVLFILGLIGFYLTLPFFIYRMIKHFEVAEHVRPTLTIAMAPANLLLAGYLTLLNAGMMPYSALILHPLMLLSVCGIIFMFCVTFKLMFGKFMQTFSGFTFPFVITATAITALSDRLFPWLSWPALIAQAAAVAVVLYVTARYLIYLTGQLKKT